MKIWDPIPQIMPPVRSPRRRVINHWREEPGVESSGAMTQVTVQTPKPGHDRPAHVT